MFSEFGSFKIQSTYGPLLISSVSINCVHISLTVSMFSGAAASWWRRKGL